MSSVFKGHNLKQFRQSRGFAQECTGHSESGYHSRKNLYMEIGSALTIMYFDTRKNIIGPYLQDVLTQDQRKCLGEPGTVLVFLP